MSLGSLDGDSSASATAVRNFLIGHLTADLNGSDEYLSEDVELNGTLFKASGRNGVSKGIMAFLHDHVDTHSVEAVTRIADSTQFLVLFEIVLNGRDASVLPLALLVSVVDGRIKRLDECANTDVLAQSLLRQQQGSQSDDQHSNGHHTDDHYSDDQHSDDQHSDGQHSDGQHSDASADHSGEESE